MTEQGPDYIASKYNTPFPPEVQEEVQRLLDTPVDLTGRRRARGVTIDNPTTRDRDDVIYVQGNGMVLETSIADVASQVPKGSHSHNEGLRRAFTRYYRNHNDPMFPHPLSEGRFSLNPRSGPKPTVTVIVPFDAAFNAGEPEFVPSFYSSPLALTYGIAERILTKDEDPYLGLLQRSHALASGLSAKRRGRGSLVFSDLESEVAMNEDGQLVTIDRRDFTAHMIIEEFMIATNTAVAKFLRQRGIPFLNRVHEVDKFREVTDLRLALQQDLPPEERNHYLTLLRDLMRDKMGRAYYTPEPNGHFALNEAAYTHFTSPIRRIADKINQEILFAVLQNQPSPYSYEELVQIGEHISSQQGTVIAQQRKFYLVDEPAMFAVSTGHWSRLDLSQRRQAAIIATYQQELKPEAAALIAQDIVQKQWKIKHIARLLQMSRQRDETWDVIASAIAQFLDKKANAYLNLLDAAGIEPDIQVVVGGTDQHRRYQVTATAENGEGKYASEMVESTSLAKARKRAITQLVRAYFGLPEVTPVQENLIKPRHESGKARPIDTQFLQWQDQAITVENVGEQGLSAAQFLNEDLQRHHISERPKVTVKQDFAGGITTFYVQLSLSLPGRVEPLTTQVYRGTDIAAVRHVAASDIRAQLAEIYIDRVRGVTVVEGNYVGAVETYAQRSGWVKKPRFAIQPTGSKSEHGTGFVCKVTYQVDANSKVESIEVYGTAKKAVRMAAARTLWDLVQPPVERATEE